MGTTANFRRLLLVLILRLLVVGSSSAKLGHNLQKFSRSHFAFSLDLYSALQKQTREANAGKNHTNLIFSPFGISVALATVFLGAGSGSSTANQLRSSLHMDSLSFHEVHDTFRTILLKLKDPYYTDLMSLSNNITKHNSFIIHDNYKEVLRDYYRITIDEDRFTTSLNRARTYRPSGGNCLAIVSEFVFRSDWFFQFNASMTFEKGLFYSSLQKRYVSSFTCAFFQHANDHERPFFLGMKFQWWSDVSKFPPATATIWSAG